MFALKLFEAICHNAAMSRPLRAVLLWTGIALLCVHVASGQTKHSDEEMKEVYRLVLEREVQRPADGTNVPVLLGSNVKSSWIPELPGFAIRQLSYEEQRKVPEYYDITTSFKGSVIKVDVAKGNYCKKVGRRYEFRRQAGAWQSKLAGYFESNLMESVRCDGCIIGSGETYSGRSQSTNPAIPPRTGDLRLTGSVRKISCSKDVDYIGCNIDLNLRFTNTGNTSLIILQPHGEYAFWHGGISLALSEKESNSYSLVYRTSYWPSIYKFPMYENLANLLDQSVPPPGLTRVLLPNASWSWDTSIKLTLREGNSCDQHVGVEIGWEEIKRRSAPLWLRVSYEMWPFNVENFKPNLGGILRKRWLSYGRLYLEEKSDRYWSAILTSEPIEFPLNQIDLAQ